MAVQARAAALAGKTFVYWVSGFEYAAAGGAVYGASVGLALSWHEIARRQQPFSFTGCVYSIGCLGAGSLVGAAVGGTLGVGLWGVMPIIPTVAIIGKSAIK